MLEQACLMKIGAAVRLAGQLVRLRRRELPLAMTAPGML
jgi:hypothetical protein